MTDRALLQQALEQITVLAEYNTTGPGKCKSEALTAAQATSLRRSISDIARNALGRLAQPDHSVDANKKVEQPAAPVIDEAAAKRIATSLGWAPRKEWQGLSQYDIDRAIGRLQVEMPDFLDLDAMTEFARAIEQASKEKNT